jgi:hypothetical protein
MPSALRYMLQAALYALFALVIGVFTTWPSFRLLAPDEGLLRLSFLHPGQPLQACRQRTPEELARMPPQMRTAVDCPRERSPVLVRVELDGQVIVDESFAPGGLARDGASAGYRSRPLPAGEHRLAVRFSDDARRRDQPVERAAQIRVAPGQVVLIDFSPEHGGVVIR